MGRGGRQELSRYRRSSSSFVVQGSRVCTGSAVVRGMSSLLTRGTNIRKEEKGEKTHLPNPLVLACSAFHTASSGLCCIGADDRAPPSSPGPPPTSGRMEEQIRAKRHLPAWRTCAPLLALRTQLLRWSVSGKRRVCRRRRVLGRTAEAAAETKGERRRGRKLCGRLSELDCTRDEKRGVQSLG